MSDELEQDKHIDTETLKLSRSAVNIPRQSMIQQESGKREDEERPQGKSGGRLSSWLSDMVGRMARRK